jgi:predicted phage-related endonuclease
MSASPPAEAFRAAEALLKDTAALAEAHTGADLGAFRQALAQRRRPLDPPPAGP